MHGDEGQSHSPPTRTGRTFQPTLHAPTRHEEAELRFRWRGSPWSLIPCFRGSERSRICSRKGLEFVRLHVFDLVKRCSFTSALLAGRGNRATYFSKIHCKTHISMLFVWHLCLCVSSTRPKVLTKVSARSFR